MTDARPASKTPARLLAIVAGMLFLAAVFAHYHGIIASGDQYDDSYITYRCSVNLAEGRGLAFNTGERTSCASSLLYSAMLAGLYRLGVRDLERAGLWTGLLSGLWVAVLATWLCASAGGIAAGVAFALPAAASGWLCGWSVSGMETALFAALVLTFTALHLSGRMGASSVALVLAMLCRPEGALLWIAALAAAWIARGRSGPRSWLPLVAGALTAAALFVFQLAYYGVVIPAPVLYKRVAIYYAPGAARQALGLAGFLLRALGPATLIAAGWVIGCWARGLRSARSAAAHPAGAGGLEPREAFLAVYLVLTMLALVTGPASDRFRYATHMLPLVLVAAAGAWGRWRPARPVHAAAFAMMAILGAVEAHFNQIDTARAFSRWAAHQHARKEIGRWIERSVPPGARVISSDVGAIAYYARSHDFLDVTGLTSLVPLRAALAADWTAVWSWLERERPALLADTRWPTGEIQSQHILEQPETFFRSLRSGASGGRTLALRERAGWTRDLETPDGYRFVVREVLW